MIKTLSVIIPVFNEEKTIYAVLEKVCQTQLINNIQKQIIVVDDTSGDNSGERIREFIDKHRSIYDIKFVSHPLNSGKGAAVRSGLELVTGDFTIIQDADLELDPSDFNLLLKKVLDENADVVFGSRFLKKQEHSIPFKTRLANKALTFFTRIVTGKYLTDMETCYKLIRTSIFKSFTLYENRFGFEPEITVKLLQKKEVVFKEVPITYKARTVQQGKKIGITDGLRAIVCLIKYRFS
jgi:glycosyltransferase involved in cell wall biosynthesis